MGVGSMPTIPFKDLAVRNIKSAGRYGFGRGHYSLCIQAEVDSTGTLRKRWEQRIRIKGCDTPNYLGLGPYPLNSMADASREAEANAKMAANGIHPRKHAAGIPLFRTIAVTVVNEGKGRKAKERRLEMYAFPKIGDMRVDKIAYSDLNFVRPLCITNPPTAHLLIMSMKKIFDRCLFDKHIASNPVDTPFMAQLVWGDRKGEHFPALPYHMLPEAMVAIDKRGKTDVATRSCLKCIILNEVRPHSAQKAGWSEILWKEIKSEHDWDDPNGWELVDWSALDGSTKSIVWRIPEDHMKQRDAFVIPVSRQFLEILKEMRAVRGQGKRNPNLIFAGREGGKLSKTSMTLLLYGLGFPSDTEGRAPTLHGFRSTARVWAKKRKVPRDIAEAALSHDTGTEVELSYMRWDLLEPRARLNQFYADYAFGNLEAGWVWVEPEVQAQLDAERLRADEAERRADEAERRSEAAERRMERLEGQLAEMNSMLARALAVQGGS